MVTFQPALVFLTVLLDCDVAVEFFAETLQADQLSSPDTDSLGAPWGGYVILMLGIAAGCPRRPA
jgi:hypothetical protein